jgi:uncharacterized membrane protein YdbT with pleckstrin-like domain
MFCPKCGEENPDTNKFCRECGVALTSPSNTVQPVSSPIRIPKDLTLTDGEIPLWFGQMSWASMWLVVLIAIVFFFTIILIPLSIILLLIAGINVWTSEYFISNKRIYIKRGLISRTLNDIKIEWVTNIFVRQGVSGRILNFGNVGISTPGEAAGAIGFFGVANPISVKAIIENTLAKYKKNS